MHHLAAEGLGNPAIGERLGISTRTAETHRTHLMNKLSLRNTADLVLYALDRGLVLGTCRTVPRLKAQGRQQGMTSSPKYGTYRPKLRASPGGRTPLGALLLAR